MAVWGYARVSSKEQNEDRQIIELQPLVTTDSHLLIEKQTGKNFDRPVYQSLKNIMREGDVLVVKSLDRLGRNYDQMKEECIHRVRISLFFVKPLLHSEHPARCTYSRTFLFLFR